MISNLIFILLFCCKSIIEIGIRNDRADIEAYGLQDLSYVYNHQGRYTEQLEVLSRAVDIWKERDVSSEYLRLVMQLKAESSVICVPTK